MEYHLKTLSCFFLVEKHFHTQNNQYLQSEMSVVSCWVDNTLMSCAHLVACIFAADSKILLRSHSKKHVFQWIVLLQNHFFLMCQNEGAAQLFSHPLPASAVRLRRRSVSWLECNGTVCQEKSLEVLYQRVSIFTFVVKAFFHLSVISLHCSIDVWYIANLHNKLYNLKLVKVGFGIYGWNKLSILIGLHVQADTNITARGECKLACRSLTRYSSISWQPFLILIFVLYNNCNLVQLTVALKHLLVLCSFLYFVRFVLCPWNLLFSAIKIEHSSTTYSIS